MGEQRCVFDKPGSQQVVTDRSANQVAEHSLLARLGIAELAARPLRSFVISSFELLLFASCQRGQSWWARIYCANLADNSLYALVVSGNVDDMPARIAGATQPDLVCIHHWFSHRPIDGAEPVCDKLQGIDHFSHLHDFSLESLALTRDRFDRRRRGEDES